MDLKRLEKAIVAYQMCTTLINARTLRETTITSGRLVSVMRFELTVRMAPRGTIRTIKHDLCNGSQDHHPSKNSVQKTICCNSTSNAPNDWRMYPKHVELKNSSINLPSCIKLPFHFISYKEPLETDLNRKL